MKTKRSIKLILFMVCLILTNCKIANAQFSIGPLLGANYFIVTNSYETFKLNFHAGLMINYQIDDEMAIELVPNYSLKGGEKNQDEIKLGYIESQVIFKYAFPSAIYLIGGSYAGINTSAKVNYDEEELDIKDDVKALDIGLLGGFGYQLDNGLGLSIKYLQGLTKVNADEGEKQKNLGMQVSLYYLFGFGKE